MRVLEEQSFQEMLDAATRRAWAFLGDGTMSEGELVVRARELCALGLASGRSTVACREITLRIEQVETDPGVRVVSVEVLVPCGAAVGVVVVDARQGGAT